MNILLDTSIIISHLRLDQTKKLLATNTKYYISDITIVELFSGKSIWESTKKKSQLTQVIKQCTRLPTTLKISQLAGMIRSGYHTQIPDAIIAATALVHKLPLATLNTKDFTPIPHLKLSKLS